MGVNLYMSFQKYRCFWLAKQGSTYTRIDLYMRKYGNVYTRVQVERVYKSNPIFEAKNTTFLEKV